MFIGRKEELKFLEDYYHGQESQLVVVYGRDGIGKTDLLRMFLKKHSGFYYLARECSQMEQEYWLKKELAGNYAVLSKEKDMTGLLAAAASRKPEKQVIVLDEFHFMVKNNPDFPQAIQKLLENSQVPVMVVLCSSSIHWVENDMLEYLKEAAACISAFLKIKELSFVDIVGYFPDTSTMDCIYLYGILGGTPKYLSYWNGNRTVKENIKGLILNRDGRLYREVPNFLKCELRELALYNTILAAMAEDDENMKLNNLYERTGFSRAKISVYLKNLIQLEVVEKVFSYDKFGSENTKKGLYRIRDHFIHFWYRFVFPNLSLLENMKTEAVYEKRVRPALDAYTRNYFAHVCREYIELLNMQGQLPFPIEDSGTWFGKDGTIDFAGVGKGKLLIADCRWDEDALSENDFQKLLSLISQSGMEPDCYYLFSKGGFTSGMEAKARNIAGIRLVELEQM